MIKTIFFDFDGVLTLDRTGNAVTAKHLSQILKMPAEEVAIQWKKAYADLDETGAPVEEAWERLCKNLGVNLERSVLYDGFASVRIDNRALNLIKNLRQKYTVGLISDNNRERYEFLDNKIGIAKHFDFTSVSCYVHATKSEPKIFEDALKKCGNKPEDCIFIDNKASNLETAAKLGIKTILYDLKFGKMFFSTSSFRSRMNNSNSYSGST